jgi:hypothetical protein
MRPIVVSKAGAVAMEASSKFKYEIASELGLRDVFKMKQDYLAKEFEMSDFTFEFEGKEIKGVKVDRKEVPPEYEMPSREEIDAYIRAREEYIATEVLWKCGWTEFVKRCELVGIEDYINEHTPCEGPDAQCYMFCFRYGKDCQL